MVKKSINAEIITYLRMFPEEVLINSFINIIYQRHYVRNKNYGESIKSKGIKRN